MADIFISYRTGDETYAAVLLDEKLCERFGRDRVFRDNRSIEPGIDFRPALWGTLARSAVVIVVIGPGWFGSGPHGRAIDDPDDFVRREIAWALRIGVRVIPVLVGAAAELHAERLPPDLAGLATRQYRRLGGRGVQDEISRLCDDIATILAGPADGTDPAHPPAATRSLRRGTGALIRLDTRSGRGRPAPQEAYNSALRAAVEAALADTGVSDVELSTTDLGLGVLASPRVHPIQLASEFITSLGRNLVGPDAPPVRVAMDQLTVRSGAGEVPAALAGLVSLPALDGVLRAARRASLVVVVPDTFFDEVIRTHPRLADPSTYLSVSSRTGALCWVHVPGYSAPPGLPSEPAPARATAAAPWAGPQIRMNSSGGAFVNHGDVHGHQVSGDLVMGDMHQTEVRMEWR